MPFGRCKFTPDTPQLSGFHTTTDSANTALPRRSLEINIGIIAATIPTLRPLFNESRFPILRYLQYIGTYFRDRRASANTPAEDGNDRGRPPRLILNTLPSALPTSMSYYRNKIRDRVGGWRDLESRISIPNLENVHLKDTRVQQMPHP